MKYCSCNNQQPEEIAREKIVCHNCNLPINPSDLDDFSEGQDVIDVEQMNDKAEQGMYRDFEVIHDCGRI